ncbi:hypothetical protein [Helicobacter sp.]|uniref:hypothetical protein n=1 Tax=Helicobacter sp. TaxID=218 RepID=UPI0025C24A1D|nr:hypothetical protein [Helicobacter sp.]MCI5969103.1 hypothetical protein [Helicobacter sp.]MDY2584246.1 hypothetical protein [Helicobacter sp.]
MANLFYAIKAFIVWFNNVSFYSLHSSSPQILLTSSLLILLSMSNFLAILRLEYILL